RSEPQGWISDLVEWVVVALLWPFLALERARKGEKPSVAEEARREAERQRGGGCLSSFRVAGGRDEVAQDRLDVHAEGPGVPADPDRADPPDTLRLQRGRRGGVEVARLHEADQRRAAEETPLPGASCWRRVMRQP